MTGTTWAARVALLAAIGALSSCDSCRGVLVYDVNPDTATGSPLPPGEDTTAGLTLRVDGTANILYAVTLNAGVYRSVPGLFDGGWVQLNASPPRAYSIAVDRSDPRHLIVGERDGDNADPASNTSGVWESADAGDGWPEHFDPRSLQPQCGSQAIPSVAISSTGTLVAATNCGIAVRPKGGSWTFAQLLPGFPSGRVTAVAASETRLWARDGDYNLVVSDASGATFVPATQKVRPAVQAGATGDTGTLAALDSLVVMVGLGATTADGQQNYTRLVIYDAARDAWIDQPRIDYLVHDPSGDYTSRAALNGNGNFAIGRRFAKAYAAGKPSPRRWAQELFVSNAQEVFHATSRNPDGTFQFERVVGTPSSDGGSFLPDWAGSVHRDLWDFHLAPDDRSAWVTADGGLFETLRDGSGWHTRYHALNTHHVQSLYVPHDEIHAAYATQDNDAWIRESAGTSWVTPGGTGDANFIAGDRGNATAVVIVRDVTNAVLAGFGPPLPTSHMKYVYGIVLNNDRTFLQSPTAFQVIQTRKGEPFDKALDAVMLTKLPFVWMDAAGAAHPIVSNGQPFALVRNRDFEAHPSVNDGQGAGWELAADNLPENPVGFRVAGTKGGPGAHTAPVYFLLAAPGGRPAIFRSTGGSNATWTRVNGQPADIVGSAKFRNGPFYVNPYDADVVYVLSATGVFVSTNATSPNATFDRDAALSALVSGNSLYGFLAEVQGGNGTNVDRAVQNGGWPTETLSDMSFDYDDPTHVAAASPFTGVFVKLGASWLNPGQALPRPLSPVVGVQLMGRRLYVATLGRGVLMLDQIDQGPPRGRPRPPRQ